MARRHHVPLEEAVTAKVSVARALRDDGHGLIEARSTELDAWLPGRRFLIVDRSVEEGNVIAVGVDTHKESLAVCAVDELGRKLGELSVANCRQGFRALERYLASLPEGRRVGIEGSGGFGAPLACVLRAAGEDVVEVPAHLTARQRKRLVNAG